MGLGLAGFGTSLVGGGRAIITRANGEIAQTVDSPTVFDALGRTVDEAAGFRAVPQVTFNQIAGSQFERQVLDALGHVGATKSTISRSVTLADGSIVNTIVDANGRNVGGLLEIKNVQELNFTRQLEAQLEIARQTRKPLNIVVSPTTTRVTHALQGEVRLRGGGIFVFDPATGLIRPFGN